MLLKYRIVNILYKIAYKLRPILVAKKLIKSLLASLMIIREQTSYYPPQIKQLENAFSSLTGKNFALSFCNGTSSLEAAIFAVSSRFENRNTIVVPSMNFHADLDAIINAGYNIKFIDVSHGSIIPSLSEVVAAVDEDTACFILCHLFGYHLETEKIADYLSSRNISFIEDCSHAHCSNSTNSMAKYCDIAFFSMQGAKPVAAGEGGVCVTDDKELFIRMSAYSHFGRHDAMFSNELNLYIGTGIGHKHRMAPIGSVLALTDIKFLNIQNEVIEDNVKKLTNVINNYQYAAVVSAKNGGTGRFGGLPILAVSEQELYRIKTILNEYGLDYTNYPFLLHHKMKRYNGRTDDFLPNTEGFANSGLLLSRKYIEFLPFYQKWIIIKAFNKIGYKK